MISMYSMSGGGSQIMQPEWPRELNNQIIEQLQGIRGKSIVIPKDLQNDLDLILDIDIDAIVRVDRLEAL